ncbi:YolD-like family protein [Paenibacillus dokdonensis]|uniref:YolD-like family protein n=1 Tax=Paenibacillus dokdonensis TaxID=2567944 RepID=UPI0010A7EFD8|nr:YolD-like family protein [Paenibacillus dokdonensis]
MENKQSNEESGYLFNVDILVKSRSNALALQAIIEMLNENENIADFRIKSGMELGQLIESMLQVKRKSLINKSGASTVTPSPLSDYRTKLKAKTEQPAASTSSPAEKKMNTTEYSSQLHEWITDCIHDNRLIRLTATRGGQPTSMPCRILNFDEINQLLNVYHVDEKQVYSFKLNEIIEVV